MRLVVAHQSLFGDELSTYWIVATHTSAACCRCCTAQRDRPRRDQPTADVRRVVARSAIRPRPRAAASAGVGGGRAHASRPSTSSGSAPSAARRRSLATALTALSPFMIYYSTEARAYGVMMVMVITSTLAMLVRPRHRARALVGRLRGRVLRGAVRRTTRARSCSPRSCCGCGGRTRARAVPWDSRTSRRARRPDPLGARTDQRPALADGHDPLRPLAVHAARRAGRPRALDGGVSVLLAGEPAAAAGDAAAPRPRARHRGRPRRTGAAVRHGRPAAASGLGRPGAAGGRAGASQDSTGASSCSSRWHSRRRWPRRSSAPSAPTSSVYATSPRPGRRSRCASPRSWSPRAGRVMIAATTLVLIAFGLAAVSMLDGRYQRPDYQSAADFIDRTARPGGRRDRRDRRAQPRPVDRPRRGAAPPSGDRPRARSRRARPSVRPARPLRPAVGCQCPRRWRSPTAPGSSSSAATAATSRSAAPLPRRRARARIAARSFTTTRECSLRATTGRPREAER